MAREATDPIDAAVLVIDMQNDFCHPDGVFARAGMVLPNFDLVVRNVNELVAAGRSVGLPIVWVRMCWDEDSDVGILAERSPFLRSEGLRAGTWGSQLVEGLEVREDDLNIQKSRFSAFFETDLFEHLVGLNVRTLHVAGVRTDFCVESTVRDAFFRDFNVIVGRDTVGGYFPELHEHSLREMSTVFAEVVPKSSKAIER